jgi:hypothetical protein
VGEVEGHASAAQVSSTLELTRLTLPKKFQEFSMSLSSTEISSLRTELVRYSDQMLDLVKFAVTATSVLIGFGLSAEDPTDGYIVLVPLLILASSFSLAMNRRQNIVRIATYLRAFAGEEFEYESRLWQLRQRRDLPWVSYQLTTLQVFIITGFICVILSFLLLIDQGLLLLIPGVAGLMWIGFSITQWRMSRRILMGGGLDRILFSAWNQTRGEKIESTD